MAGSVGSGDKVISDWCYQDAHDHFIPGVAAIREIEAPTSRARIVEYDGARIIDGCWYSDAVHYVDMALTPRPRPSRGCHIDLSGEYRDLGKIFLVPAGIRFRAEGSTARHSTLNLFVGTRSVFPDEDAVFGDGASLLSDCFQIENDGVRDTLVRISNEIREPGFASALLIEGLSVVLLAELARLLKKHHANRARKGGLAHWRLRLIEQRLHDEPSIPNLAELAALCGLSRRHLMRAFREETGGTIGAFVEAAALDRAKRLLSETDTPIAAVAAQGGFATAAGFSVAFRRATGQTPRSFRVARACRDDTAT
jgi:AraC family transcriptional regulator